MPITTLLSQPNPVPSVTAHPSYSGPPAPSAATGNNFEAAALLIASVVPAAAHPKRARRLSRR
ncbi:hypothetical protein [Nocardia sp. CS682]|uniref:hypothetical protein n=1 Tax=Nocardia sp. CS682 TaxID=1047172 RepID=UPI0010754FC3|nr:hypothetical protein [Nocardia sp. CS682]QBS39615.1 hypothetical protein DMB37_05170 [Nocardia sp. CS682]